MNTEKQSQLLREALKILLEKCPVLSQLCYWAGTAPIALEELGHRQSFDLDFHTRKALQDVRPILARLRAAFPDDFETVQAPDDLGSGFRGLLTLSNGERVTIEVLSNYEDIDEKELVPAESPIQRISLARYLADKLQCVAERTEARDLVDIHAVLQAHHELHPLARKMLSQQDALLLAERLLAWTDQGIEQDLEAYPDVDPSDAKKARQQLLGWLKTDTAD